MKRFSVGDGYNLSITYAAGKRFTGLAIKNHPSLLSFDMPYFVIQKIL